MAPDYRNTLLISAVELKSETLISGNVDEKLLNGITQTSQNVYLSKITGTALMTKLQELVYNQIKGYENKIHDDDNADYLDLLENYVKPFLKYRVLRDSVFSLGMKFKNIGVVNNSDQNTNTVDINALKYLENHYDSYVSEYEEKLSKYLYFNKDKFPELSAEHGPYMDSPTLGKDFAPTNLWLGSRNKKTCGGCN